LNSTLPNGDEVIVSQPATPEEAAAIVAAIARFASDAAARRQAPRLSATSAWLRAARSEALRDALPSKWGGPAAWS